MAKSRAQLVREVSAWEWWLQSNTGHTGSVPANALQTDSPESQVLMTDDGQILTMDE